MNRVYRFPSVLVAAAAPAAAQCSMCRTALSAGAGDTFNRAIVILLVPAVALFGTIFLAVCRYGGSGGEKEEQQEHWEE